MFCRDNPDLTPAVKRLRDLGIREGGISVASEERGRLKDDIQALGSSTTKTQRKNDPNAPTKTAIWTRNYNRVK